MGIMVGFDGAKVASNGNCGFFIVSDESKLGTINVPVGGIVKLQDSGKMLERTADGWKNYEMGGGSSGGGGNVFEMLHGYMSFDTAAWVQTDEEKALNAQLYTKIVVALENDEFIGLYSKASTQEADIKYHSMATYYVLYNGIIMLKFMSGDGDYKAQITADGAITANFVE